MLCERCGIREANIQYTEVINGVKKEHHFCAQCAREMDFGPYSAIFDGEFPLGKLLSGLLGIEDTSRGPDKFSQVVCPSCKTSYEEFIKNSSFGCSDCYSVFGPLMEENLKQLQGSVTHTGKKPKHQMIRYHGLSEDEKEAGTTVPELGHEEELMEWDAKLKEALQFEDYETAAVCRDKIREIKKGHEANA